MIIRKWTEDDLKDIITLLHQLNETLEEGQELKEETIKQHFKEMEDNKDIYENYVIIDKDKVVGYMSLFFYRSLYHKEGTAQINELIIDKEYRNKGYGKELLEFGVQRAEDRNMDEIEIGVEKSNNKALEFYKRNGIEEEYLLLGKELKSKI